MKGILGFALVALLVMPSAFCANSLLRLERTDTPGGVWQEVPANTLPITEEGALLDTYESATGFYRMRIEPVDQWVPLSMPLEEAPSESVGIAKQLLNDLRDLDGDNSWERRTSGPQGFRCTTSRSAGGVTIQPIWSSPCSVPSRSRLTCPSRLSRE